MLPHYSTARDRSSSIVAILCETSARELRRSSSCSASPTSATTSAARPIGSSADSRPIRRLRSQSGCGRFRYFVNNLAPGMRAFWIHYSDRVRVDEFMRDDLVRFRPEDVVPPASPDSPTPRAVVLNSEGVLLGTIERSDAAPRALDAMNPNPQTIRPDMTPRLAAQTAEIESVFDRDNSEGQIPRPLRPQRLNPHLSITPSPEISS